MCKSLVLRVVVCWGLSYTNRFPSSFQISVASWLGYWLFSWVLSFLALGMSWISWSMLRKLGKKGLRSVWNGRLNVRRRRQNVRLRKNVKQKNVPRPSVWLIWLLTRRREKSWMMPQMPCHKKLRFLHLNLKSVIMPLRTTMIICLQRIMRISKKIMHLIQRMCQARSFPHLWWLREMMPLLRLISRLRNSCSINYLI